MGASVRLIGRGLRTNQVHDMVLYRRIGQPEGYVRVHGISSLRHEGMVLEYVEAHGRIERKDVMKLCGLSSVQAGRLLRHMVADGKLVRQGTPPRWTYYVLSG
ncbi:MAG: hypothetical protein M1546_20925 [Chloroflexi bacterium]|nr:hypothetical protein [Chloroflexota bacterium]